MKEVCKDVRTEPALLPVEPNRFSNSHTTSADGARLDISVCGLRSTFEYTYFDVRVCHSDAVSNVTLSHEELLKRNEKEKRDLYEERVREVEKASFSPMVFLTSGGVGPECNSVLKRVAHLIADKRGEEYSHVINFIRTKLRFSLLKSTLMAVRGNRGKPHFEPNVGLIAFNCIPRSGVYDS